VKPEIVNIDSALLAKNLLTHTQSKILGMVVNSSLANQQTFNQFIQAETESSSPDLLFEQQLKHLLSEQRTTTLESDINHQYYDYLSTDTLTVQQMASSPPNNSNEQISLQRLEFWIDEQEQELAMKKSEISYLQDRLYSSSYSNDKEALELRITEETENLNFLEESLEGQRRQIRERLELLSDI